MAMDPCEEFFVTGSAEGDIKVWGLSQHQLIKTYQGEHYKGSMFSRTPSAGVLQLHVTNEGQLFSAGADGTLRVRLISDENHMSPHVSYYEFANAQASKSFSLS
ncbi:Rbcn-3A [Bugula neritina]|uniref:Rbcn-3A n=1 Tax=Bugula neritina TaxID=10212 RepID=A0A7J7JHS4_BUGNE|nr:Rbcn-3A [Bugula neritina]